MPTTTRAIVRTVTRIGCASAAVTIRWTEFDFSASSCWFLRLYVARSLALRELEEERAFRHDLIARCKTRTALRSCRRREDRA